jgi:hypothetical protein
MRFDASLLIVGPLLLVAPLAALIPPLVNPRFTSPASGPDRTLIYYLFVAVFAAVLLFAFAGSGLSMAPEAYWHTLFSNALIFAGILIMDTLAAFSIYRFMQVVRSAPNVKDEKPV